MVRRLFQRLQQRIERRIGNLVRLIQDVNLVLISCRPVSRRIAQFANLIDAAIGRRIDLNHINRIARPDLRAALANLTWLCRWSLRRPDRIPAVQRHRQNARNRRLPNSAMPAEDVTMRYPILRECIHQRHGHVILSRYIRETLWPILPCKNLICHIKIKERVSQQSGQSSIAATPIVSPAGRALIHGHSRCFSLTSVLAVRAENLRLYLFFLPQPEPSSLSASLHPR